MRKYVFPSGNTVGLSSALAALVMAIALPLTAFSADRLVICEEFTECGT